MGLTDEISGYTALAGGITASLVGAYHLIKGQMLEFKARDRILDIGGQLPRESYSEIFGTGSNCRC